MKDVNKILEEKLYLHFPSSMQIIEDALTYMVEHNLNNTTGAILTKELSKDHQERKLEMASFQKLLMSKGFSSIIEPYNSIFLGIAAGRWDTCCNVYICNNSKVIPKKNKEIQLYTLEKPFKIK